MFTVGKLCRFAQIFYQPIAPIAATFAVANAVFSRHAHSSAVSSTTPGHDELYLGAGVRRSGARANGWRAIQFQQERFRLRVSGTVYHSSPHFIAAVFGCGNWDADSDILVLARSRVLFHVTQIQRLAGDDDAIRMNFRIGQFCMGPIDSALIVPFAAIARVGQDEIRNLRQGFIVTELVRGILRKVDVSFAICQPYIEASYSFLLY